jgi:hypothetical protein
VNVVNGIGVTGNAYLELVNAYSGSTPICQTGQHWNGIQCVDDTPICQTGQHWNGTACVDDTPLQTLNWKGYVWSIIDGTWSVT